MPHIMALLPVLCLLLPGSAPAALPDAASLNPSSAPVRAVSSSGIPIGAIVAWPVSHEPYDTAAWLECRGQTVTAAAYPDLVAALTGSSSTASAVLPDLRGLFLRGQGSQNITQNNGSRYGDTTTTHSSGAFMSAQGDATRPVQGTLPVGGQIMGGENLNSNLSGSFNWSGPAASPGQGTGSASNMQAYFDNALVVPVDGEIRPANMAVRYLMRAR